MQRQPQLRPQCVPGLERTIRRTASRIVPVLVEVDRSSQKVTILDESGERAPIVLENWHARAFIARFDALLDAALDVTLEAAAKYLAAPHIRCAWRDRTTSPAVAQPIAISPSAPHAAARV